MLNASGAPSSWQHPKELLKLQKLKFKKRALQERINGSKSTSPAYKLPTQDSVILENVLNSRKRKNPFAVEEAQVKKGKISEEILSETTDPTLFKLLNNSTSTSQQEPVPTSFSNILSTLNNKSIFKGEEIATEEKFSESTFCPVDWTLKRKMRLISLKPFPWSQKLKISEESSGITSFTRCLDMEKCDISLDVSPNAQFHQCSLYWQHPYLPWLTLFPRSISKSDFNGMSLGGNSVIKTKLYESWTDSFTSLYHLIKTRQCPYFYVCANSFTALFRASGISGYADFNVMVSPSTRGFRSLLTEEGIEFHMPLKFGGQIKAGMSRNGAEEDAPGQSNLNHHHDDPELEEDLFSDLGINAEDIKHIMYTQNRIEHITECQVDRTDQSLILIKGMEVNAFFNFLLNCKSTIPSTGPLAGVPPTLLSPVAFCGATLNALKVRENKMHSEGNDYFSIELTGPVLPSTVHNIFNTNSHEHSVTMTFSDVESTRSFSQGDMVNPKKGNVEERGSAIFGKENLKDCGLSLKVLNSFCSRDAVSNLECLKYSGETGKFTWS
ncbi:protein downstream neighbor of son homolog [Euwallacea similis]|uniref:protein downstream neighbor of son homolog n=1 Tax=Euwallacea similis TaxID=1736056 RepID=UPI0034508892